MAENGDWRRETEKAEALSCKAAAIAAATTELFSLRTSADRATFVAADGAG
jgi:hypothetical protein